MAKAAEDKPVERVEPIPVEAPCYAAWTEGRRLMQRVIDDFKLKPRLARQFHFRVE